MKGMFIIGFAVFIDALQAALGLGFAALQAVTPAGGGIGAAGFCYAAGAGVIESFKCFAVGAGASAFAIPIGAAVDVAISFTLGSALIAAIAFSGAFSMGPIVSAFIGESMPLLDIIPGWTLMAWRCVHNKSKADKALAAQQQAQTVNSQSVQAPVAAFDGIRPANDNQSYEAQLAA